VLVLPFGGICSVFSYGVMQPLMPALRREAEPGWEPVARSGARMARQAGSGTPLQPGVSRQREPVTGWEEKRQLAGETSGWDSVRALFSI